MMMMMMMMIRNRGGRENIQEYVDNEKDRD